MYIMGTSEWLVSSINFLEMVKKKQLFLFTFKRLKAATNLSFYHTLGMPTIAVYNNLLSDASIYIYQKACKQG